ncbi:MAG: hypothetical protein ACPMAG_10325, partial [Limisphaerales bacterium]
MGSIILSLLVTTLNILAATTNQTSPPNIASSTSAAPLYSFRAENLEMKQALALFARTYDLNIVPDLDITGEVTVD